MLVFALVACSHHDVLEDSAAHVDTQRVDTSTVDSDSGKGETADTVDSADSGDTVETAIVDTSVYDEEHCGWDEWDNERVQTAYEHIISGETDGCERAYYTSILDERSTGAGPWLENLFVVYTPDGLDFDFTQRVALYTSGAVPECVRGDDGRYYLFFGEGSLDRAHEIVDTQSDWQINHGLLGWGALDMAVSDDGINFERVDGWGINGLVHGLVVDPDIIRLPDGTWRMYYVATPVPELVQPGAWADGVDHDLYYAESADLITWEQIGLAVVGPNADPTAHCTDATCIVASTGVDWSTSTDGGATFTFEEGEDPFGFAPKFFDTPDGRLRLYYNSRVKGGALDAWISDDDGATFTEEGQIVADRTVEAVSLCPTDDGGYYMYYHYWADGYSGDSWDTGGG